MKLALLAAAALLAGAGAEMATTLRLRSTSAAAGALNLVERE